MADNKEEKEIDLLGLGKKLWDNKRFIIKATLIGMVVGLIIAFSIPKEYTSTVVLMPDSQSSSTGTMSSLAALAGINIGAGDNALVSPDLYPNIFQSTPFLMGLFEINVKDAELNIDTTFYSYMSEHQKYTWWSYLITAPLMLKSFLFAEEGTVNSDNHNIIISEEESVILENLRERIGVTSDKKTGITTIAVTMQSPVISAFIADSLTSYFQTYMIDYRTQKARNDLEYAEKLYNDSQKKYYKAQQELASFVDGNLNVVSAKYKTRQDRLQNEANLAYSVYNQTAQQLQLARVKVQDNTPVFTIIQPAIQPIKPSKPSKKLIFIGIAFLAFAASGCWVLRDDLKEIVLGN